MVNASLTWPSAMHWNTDMAGVSFFLHCLGHQYGANDVTKNALLQTTFTEMFSPCFVKTEASSAHLEIRIHM